LTTGGAPSARPCRTGRSARSRPPSSSPTRATTRTPASATPTRARSPRGRSPWCAASCLPGRLVPRALGRDAQGGGDVLHPPAAHRDRSSGAPSPRCASRTPSARGGAEAAASRRRSSRSRSATPRWGPGPSWCRRLRYLTDALLQSLYVHGRLDQHGDRWYIRLADGLPLNDPSQESLPSRRTTRTSTISSAHASSGTSSSAASTASTSTPSPSSSPARRCGSRRWTTSSRSAFSTTSSSAATLSSALGSTGSRTIRFARGIAREVTLKHTNFVRHFREEKGKRKGDVWNAAIKAAPREASSCPLLRSKPGSGSKAEAVGPDSSPTSRPTGSDAHRPPRRGARGPSRSFTASSPSTTRSSAPKVYKERKSSCNPALGALASVRSTRGARSGSGPGDKLELSPDAGGPARPRTAEARAQRSNASPARCASSTGRSSSRT
jgi:hypothetical protein